VQPPRGRHAEDRSEALLLAHLSADQQREYGASGTVTVVKEGVIWRAVLSFAAGAFVLATLAIAGRIVPGLEGATALAALGFVTALGMFLVWIPPLAVACTRRRVWILARGRRPALVIGSRRIEFCVNVRGDVPDGDRILAFKNVLEADERYFLRKANALV